MNDKTTYPGLLGSIDWTLFFQQYWQQQPLYIDRKDPAYFKDLVSTEQVDFIINTEGGSKDFVISVIGSHKEAPGLGAATKPKTFWNAANVYDYFSKGATIRIGNIAKYAAPIRKLQQHFESKVHTDININLYLTPPNARAFEAHYDDHDVFIIQVEGTKTWKLFSPAAPVPVETLFRGRASWLNKGLPGKTKLRILPPVESERAIKLQPGDLLYVPRGHVHKVSTEDDSSLHLTIALPVVTWYEVVVHSLMETLQHSDVLREALPPGFSEKDFTGDFFKAKAGAVKAALNEHLKESILLNSLDEMAKQFIVSRLPLQEQLSTILQSEAQLKINSRVKIKEDIIYRLEEGVTDATLYFSGGHLSYPIRALSMLEHILQHKAYTVEDLPTQMNDESRLTITRQLITAGFLEQTG